MTPSADLKVRCPSCGTKYRLPTHAMGRRARCVKCQALFRVAGSNDSTFAPSPAAAPVTTASTPASDTVRSADARHPPTEDDILRWLADAESDAERERRDERQQDGVDAFDMPAATRLVREDTGGTAPRLRLHVNDEDHTDTDTATPLIRRVM